jgi:xylan 1,4-beta-xylosidase
MAEDGLPKPAFNAFKALHRLGDKRIDVTSNSALVTRRADGTVVVAVWNLFLPEEKGEAKTVAMDFKGLKRGARRAAITRVDATHGSLLNAYEAMGRPAYPTQAEIEKLRQAAELPPAEVKALTNGELNLVLPPHGLAVIEIR